MIGGHLFNMKRKLINNVNWDNKLIHKSDNENIHQIPIDIQSNSNSKSKTIQLIRSKSRDFG